MKLKTLSAAILLSSSTMAFAQHHDDGHAHMGPTVSCTDMATPPWAGLPATDRQQVASLRKDLAAFNTPETAKAAGFMPVLGDIPGMGVHYVNMAVSMRGTNLDVNVPDQLLFSQDQLVGAAYSFTDVPDTKVPLPFNSDLASWHDHPQFAREGQTLHMLHVWFVPSSNGPFAGLNFWLPYETAGVSIPNPCWMANETDADVIRNVSFALVDQEFERTDMLAALDIAARNDDRGAWLAAADEFMGDLSSFEVSRVKGLLGVLGDNQMSSAERDAAGIAQPRSGSITEALNE
ncbi:MAG TPA: hypothetical protein EYQ21_00980 [Flavobacteriales bacterium]|jgi:hypothetical protein|nr:hypothetical protein [Flavobacteriales bacterium]